MSSKISFHRLVVGIVVLNLFQPGLDSNGPMHWGGEAWDLVSSIATVKNYLTSITSIKISTFLAYTETGFDATGSGTTISFTTVVESPSPQFDKISNKLLGTSGLWSFCAGALSKDPALASVTLELIKNGATSTPLFSTTQVANVNSVNTIQGCATAHVANGDTLTVVVKGSGHFLGSLQGCPFRSCHHRLNTCKKKHSILVPLNERTIVKSAPQTQLQDIIGSNGFNLQPQKR